MDQDKIKHMFGAKRSLSLSETPDSMSSGIVIPASQKYEKDKFSVAEPEDKQFYSEKELMPVRGSWDFKKSTPILEASLTDYLAKERMHTRQAGVIEHPTDDHDKKSMSLNDLKSQTGVYHDYALSNHLDYSPAQEIIAPQQPEHFTGEEVPYNMSYLPEESQAIPGVKGYSAFSVFMTRVMTVSLALLSLPFLALGGLYALQGPQGEQWVLAKNKLHALVQYAQGSQDSLLAPTSSETTPLQDTSYSAKNASSLHNNSRTKRKNKTRRFGVGGTVLSGGRNETEIPLMIQFSKQGIPKDQLVKVSGLPANTVLSKGHYMTAGVWMVPVKDMDGLSLRVKGRLKRDVELNASFIDHSGQLFELASYKIPKTLQNYDFANQQDPASGKTGADSRIKTASRQLPVNNRTRHMNLASRNAAQPAPAEKPSPAQKALSEKIRQQQSIKPVRIHPVYEQQQLNRASIYLAKSDFKTARDILEKTALAGSARAATALARSYDPKFLLKIKVRGIKANIDKARHWYKQAVKLGNAKALKRLGQLK